MRVAIAGSGPAGVFAALGALHPELEIWMLDPALELPPELAARAAEIARRSPDAWSEDDLAFVKGGMRTTTAGIPEKTLYGSDFASRPLPWFPLRCENCQLYSSHARGGLSNVWGRGVEPLPAGEREGWPDLDASYRDVLAHLPFVAADDDLAGLLPLHTTHYQQAPLSQQFEQIERRLAGQRDALAARGIHFGRSRFLIDFGAGGDARACRRCNLCLYGCPYGALYTTASTLDDLRGREGFSYRPGLALESFREQGEQVCLSLIEVASGERSELEVDRLILAAGVVNSTRIAMTSLGVTEACLKTSDMVQIPLLSLRRAGSLDEPTYSLAQLTLAIRDPAISPRAVVVHLFGYNPLLRDVLRTLLPPPLERLLRAPIRWLLGRVLVASALIDSGRSARIELRLEDGGLRATGRPHPQARRVARRLGRKLLAVSPRTGLVPLLFLTSRKPPGGAVHNGGSLPLGGPGPLASESDGRLRGCRHVYVADAAALPEVPAGSFTLTLMANALRVGRAVRDAIATPPQAPPSSER